MRRLALFFLLAAALPCAAQAQLYRWQDADGITHYTRHAERIPGGVEAAPVVAGEASTTPGVAARPTLDAPDVPDAPPRERAPGPPPTAPAAPRPAYAPDDPASEIAALERQIEESREAIRTLIGASSWSGAQLAEDPQLRALAERLPRLQERLDALRAGSSPPAP